MSGMSGGIGGLPVSPAAECEPGPEDCTISHSATGWCLQATGAPVILLIRVSCDDENTVTVTTIDASSGDTIPNGPVVPCGDRDWETNQLCDIDPLTGTVIATVTQIFEWDETTGAVNVRLEEAGNPGVPYVVQGELGTCSGGQLEAITTIVCGNDGGSLRQLSEVVIIDTHDGTVRTVYYLDAEGVLTAPAVTEVMTVGDCWTPNLPAILSELQEIDDNTDGLEGLLTTLISEVDQVEELLTSINSNTDGLEGLATTANALLTAIGNNTDGIEPLLTSLLAATDGLEACCAATNANLTTLIGHVDGLEGLQTTANGLLTQIRDYVDTVESLLSVKPFAGHGQTAPFGAAAVQMHAAGTVAQKGVIVKARSTNSGIVFVGNSNAVTVGTGFELEPGASVTLPITNSNLVWLIGSAAGQVVTWVVV